LIFGMTALGGEASPSGPLSSLLMLTALSLTSIVLLPIATATALRVQLG
jgi:hypothetical protein